MPRIAIIGRQNVGKSTFFNALIGRRKSIVFDKPGVTRDLVQEKVDWAPGNWHITDFPGLEFKKNIKKDILTEMAIERALNSLQDYQLLLWVVSRHGLTEYDIELNKILRRGGFLVWLVINFVDDPALEADATDFYSLGYEKVSFVSALNKRGIKAIRNDVVEYFGGLPIATEERPKKSEEEIISLAIIGKPNSGKSTLFNRLLDKEKALTSEIAGTTLDSLDDEFSLQGQKIKIIDTAGLRKRSRVDDLIERFSRERTLDAIKRADTVILLVDPDEGIDRQNRNILQMIEDEICPLIVAVNKSDNLTAEKRKKIEDRIQTIQNQSWNFPVIFVSAKTGKRVTNLIENSIQLVQKGKKTTTTSKLNEILIRIVRHTIFQRNRIKVNYIIQKAPRREFIIFSNRDRLPDNVYRFLIKGLSKALFDNELPIKLVNRKKNKRLGHKTE